MKGNFDGVDASEMYKLSEDLSELASLDITNFRQATEVTARKVKESWKTLAASSKMLRFYPLSVSYDIETSQGVVRADVGPVKGGGRGQQGTLGNIAEFGTINNAPRPSGAKALAQNAEDFAKGIQYAERDTAKRYRL